MIYGSEDSNIINRLNLYWDLKSKNGCIQAMHVGKAGITI